MASINNHVNVVTSTTGVSITKPGFGTLMLLSNSAAWVGERTRTYAAAAEVGEDFAADSPEQLAANAIFGQDPCPETIKIGRRALPSTLKYALSAVHSTAGHTYEATVKGEGVTETEISIALLANVDFTTTHATETVNIAAHGMATGDGPYRLSNAAGALPAGYAVDTDYWWISTAVGTGKLAASYADAIALTPVAISGDGTGTHTLLRAANDVLMAQLKDRINSVVGKNFLATQVAGALDTDSLAITATGTGEWFAVEIASPLDLEIAMTHADPGVATDLAAIQTADQAWYALYSTTNSNLEAKAIAAWVQANKKLVILDFNETKAITVAVGGATDTIDDLHTLGYSRVATFYHPNPSQMAAAAWFGRCLPINPGQDNWKFMELEGIATVELSTTQRANLVAKKGNSIETVLGAKFTFEGTTTDGGFIDTRRNLDFIDAEIGTRTLALLVGNDKVPQTNAGYSQVKGKIRAALKFCASDEYPILDKDRAIVVTCPDVADVSEADRLARRAPDFAWSAFEAGAINSVNPIRGLVTQ